MRLYVGMQAPHCYELLLEADGVETDLSTVLAGVTLSVEKPRGGGVVSWDADIVTQSTTQLKLRHVFAETDLDRPGLWAVFARLPVAGGELTSETRVLHVFARFDISNTNGA